MGPGTIELMEQHREFLDLLPWYVNGSLAEDERSALEVHLKGCLPCNAALREERRLQSIVQQQETVPLGRDHGISSLLRRIDGVDSGRARRATFGSQVLAYGVAAAFGGAIVWVLLLFSGVPQSGDAGFGTLSIAADEVAGRIDVIFAEAPSRDAVRAFAAEIGGEFVAGPSELGRYTFAVSIKSDAELAVFVASLGEDPRIRFAGKSFIPEPPQAEEVP